MAKYDPLERHLKSQPSKTTTLTLSFPQIETILGAALPPSALQYQAWWANQIDTFSHRQAQSWLAAGFEVDDFRQAGSNSWVRFKRR